MVTSDAEIDALIERIQEATRDIETGERLHEGVFAHVTVEDAEQAAAFLAALRDERDILADRIRVLDPLLKERCDEAQNFYERADKAEARVRELEQKLERARLAMEPFGQAANDAEEFAGHDGPIGQYIQFEILRRARATLAEIGQRG